MRTKLPTINVTGCHDCPLVVEAYDFSSDSPAYFCGYGVRDTPYHVTDEHWKKVFPEDCPGKKYDVIVEFPDE